MFIDSYNFTPPVMEIIFHFYEEDHYAILLQAPCEWANSWFENQFDTTLTVEYADHYHHDISQHYLLQPPADWLTQLPNDSRDRALEKFIQFCTNVSLGGSVRFG